MDKSSIREKVFETEWFSIDAVPCASLSDEPYYRLSCKDAVTIVALTDHQKIVLVRQYRPAVESYMLELPAGYMRHNESSKEAIERELKEETGFICKSLVGLGSFKICPSRINNTIHSFFGRVTKAADAQKKTEKEIDIVLITKDEFEKLIFKGKFVDIAGIAFYFLSKALGLIGNSEQGGNL